MYETSALLDLGIEDAFQTFVATIIRQMQATGITMPIQIEKKQKRHRGCC